MCTKINKQLILLHLFTRSIETNQDDTEFKMKEMYSRIQLNIT